MTRSRERFKTGCVSIEELSAKFRNHQVTSTDLTRTALDLANGPHGTAVFTYRCDARALGEAAAADRLRDAGSFLSPLAGLPVTIKDVFDLCGETTSAGSRVLSDATPATEDAEVVWRLRAAGAVLLGRTNMTEFAYSGLGLNPHFGTPRNPSDSMQARIPGGSSSRAAVSVATGIAACGIGTDTGGSVRIPAALCGLVGFKPTAARVPQRGMLPLSPSLDSVGPIARSVACCAVVDSILSGEPLAKARFLAVNSLRLAVIRTLVWEGTDRHVANATEAAIDRLRSAGARVVDVEVPEFLEITAANSAGGFAAAESFAWHRRLLEKRAEQYDPRVRSRIERGRSMTGADYIDLLGARRSLTARVSARVGEFDAWLMPTVPLVAPRFDELDSDDAYFELNRLMLRNPSFVNFLDGCAISLPCHAPGSAPVGISLVAACNADRHLLSVAAAVERLISG